MRLSSIFREGRRNVTSGTTRAVTLATVLAAASVLLVGADVAAVLGIENDAAAFQAAGASIRTISAPGRIDGQRCEDLGELPGVVSAGAIATTAGSSITAAALPDAPIPAGAVTPDFPLWAASQHRATSGVILSSEAADMLDLDIGDTLSTTDGRTTVAGVYSYPRDGRRSGFGYMVLLPAGPSQVFDECWVDTWPTNDDITSLLLTTIVPGAAASEDLPTVGQLNSTMGDRFDGYAEYSHRITRFGGLVAGLFAAVLGFVALRARRLQLASALHSRVSRRDLSLISAIEASVWVLPAPLLCMATAVLALGAPPDGAVAATIGARVALPVVVGAAVGLALALILTRERHLFAYARDR